MFFIPSFFKITMSSTMPEDQGFEKEGGIHRHHHHHHCKITQEQKAHFQKHPGRQNFAQHLAASVNIEPSANEIEDLASACGRLWDLDANRLKPGQDYEINVGEGKKEYDKEDIVQNSLFRFVHEDVFNRPTFARFYSLLDNYSAAENIEEIETPEKENEELAFIEEISRTAPIQYVYKFLATKGLVSAKSMDDFKKLLHELWFKYYDRGGATDSSSAFEHVFVGEIKTKSRHGGGSVSGFHNWIQFYVEEARGRVEYLGYIIPKKRSAKVPDSHSQFLTIQFKWMDLLKPLSSTFVGVSPEFELALYTLCFYGGRQNTEADLGPYHVIVKVYHLGDGSKIGSAFPEASDDDLN